MSVSVLSDNVCDYDNGVDYLDRVERSGEWCCARFQSQDCAHSNTKKAKQTQVSLGLGAQDIMAALFAVFRDLAFFWKNLNLNVCHANWKI